MTLVRPTVIVTPVKELTSREFKQCDQLNFRHSGEMMYKLRDLRHDDDEGYALRIVENDVLIAWSLVFKISDGGCWCTSEFCGNNGPASWGSHYYTRTSHRRMGYGRLLREAVKKQFGEEVNTFGWDYRSDTFFYNT